MGRMIERKNKEPFRAEKIIDKYIYVYIKNELVPLCVKEIVTSGISTLLTKIRREVK